MYDFYINRIRLPIAPARVSFRHKNRNEQVETVGGYELTLINPVGLACVAFSFILPQNFSDMRLVTDDEGNTGWDIFRTLEAHKKDGDIVVFRIARRYANDAKSIHDSRILATIEELSMDEDAAELGKICA